MPRKFCEVGELERGDRDLAGDVLELLRRQVFAEAGLLQALAGLAAGHLDQVVQLQDAALAGLERLAVGPVHGAEADVLELALGGVARLVGGAEHDLEMVGLALVDAIDDEVGAERPLAVQDGGEVGGAVHGRAFGRDHQQGRQLALVPSLATRMIRAP